MIERGTKSIDTMLYFMLFNIAPTVLQLAVVAVIFKINFGWGLVGATALTVVAYIWVTRTITEWRTQPAREDEPSRRAGNGAGRRFAAQLRNGQIFLRRGARGGPLRAGNPGLRRCRGEERKQLGAAQHRPGVRREPADGGSAGLHGLGLVTGQVHRGAARVRADLPDPVVPAAGHARDGLSHDPPGVDRHGGDVRADRHRGRGEGRAQSARRSSSHGPRSRSTTLCSATRRTARSCTA